MYVTGAGSQHREGRRKGRYSAGKDEGVAVMSAGKVVGAGKNESRGGAGTEVEDRVVSDSSADSGSVKSQYQSSPISCFSSEIFTSL